MSDARALIMFDNSKDLGAWYDKKYTEMGGGWKVGAEEANRLIDWAKLERGTGKSLLDIGCGDGDFLSHIYPDFICEGIDLSNVGIEFCRARGIGVTFWVQDIEQAFCKPERYDYLTSIGSIEHVVDLGKALARCYKILKPGGVFLVLAPNELWKYEDQPQEQTHTDEEWVELFEKAGFECTKQQRRADLTDFVFVKANSKNDPKLKAE
jgi:ubiquinone/menaquinone biosynthesis C-methylase UbiE